MPLLLRPPRRVRATRPRRTYRSCSMSPSMGQLGQLEIRTGRRRWTLAAAAIQRVSAVLPIHVRSYMVTVRARARSLQLIQPVVLQCRNPGGPRRTAQSLRERWRKTLKARFTAANGDPAAAAAAQHAAQVAKATAAAARRSSLDGGNNGGQRRRSLDGGAAGTASAIAAAASGSHQHHTRQKVPKSVANALWRRDCGEVRTQTHTVRARHSLAHTLTLPVHSLPPPVVRLSCVVAVHVGVQGAVRCVWRRHHCAHIRSWPCRERRTWWLT